MAITLVQTAHNGVANSTSYTVTLGVSPTNGNFITLVTDKAANGNGAGNLTVTQTGVTWAVAHGLNGRTSQWLGTVGSGAGTVITIGNMAAASNSAAIADEWSGLPNMTVDKAADNSGSSAAPDTGTTATTSVGTELWNGFGYQSSSTASFSAPTNGFTLLSLTNEGGSGVSVFRAYKIVSTTGTANCTVTSSVNTGWDSQVSTYQTPSTAAPNSLMMMGIGL